VALQEIINYRDARLHPEVAGFGLAFCLGCYQKNHLAERDYLVEWDPS